MSMIQTDLAVSFNKQDWQEVVKAKRDEQAVAVARFVESLGTEAAHQQSGVTAIVDIQDIPRKIAAGEITAEAVAIAHINQIVRAHQQTNCLTEVIFAEAIDEAKRLDQHFKTTGKLVGPFHGVPVTVKDQFNVQGYDTTLGYVGRAFKPATEDAYVVDILRKAGAVILAKTNVSHTTAGHMI